MYARKQEGEAAGRKVRQQAGRTMGKQAGRVGVQGGGGGEAGTS